jgi:hypothetical protein
VRHLRAPDNVFNPGGLKSRFLEFGQTRVKELANGLASVRAKLAPLGRLATGQ